MSTWTVPGRWAPASGARPAHAWEALRWWLLGLAALVPVAAAMVCYPQHLVTLAWAIPAVVAAVAVVLYRPAWGACALILLVYWNASDVITESFGFSWVLRIAIAGALAAWLIERLLCGDRRRQRWPLLMPLGVWGAAQTLCTLTAVNRSVAAGQLLEYGKALVVFYLVANLLRSPRWWRRGVDAVMAALVLLSLPVLYQGFTGSHFTFWGFGSMEYAATAPGQFGWRFGGAMGDPNFLAMVLVAALPLAIMQALEPRAHWFRRLWSAGVLAATLGALLFTYSRGAAVGLAIMVAALLVLHPRRKWILVVSLAGMLLASALAPQALWGRLSTLVDNSLAGPGQQMTDASFRVRRHVMLTGLVMFLHHPVAGVGLGNFDFEYYKYSAMAGLIGEDVDRDPHSLYTQLLAETGLVGTAAFVWLLVAAYQAMERGRRRAARLGAGTLARLVAACELALAVYLVCSIFLHDAYFRHFYLLLALGVVGAALARELSPGHRRSASVS
ncbi:MAG: O-antigen ligase family protein [Terriglobales bacterium]